MIDNPNPVSLSRLTLKLAHIREGQNKINEAATVLQDLQVETFGSMDRKEKCEFILEQMRFCLANKDIIRAQIISKKIQTRYFKDKADDVEVQKLKLKYYRLMVELKSREENYLEVATFYQNMLQTDIILKNDAERVNGTKAVLLYCLLAEHAPEQVTLLHNTYNLDTIEDDLPDYGFGLVSDKKIFAFTSKNLQNCHIFYFCQSKWAFFLCSTYFLNSHPVVNQNYAHYAKTIAYHHLQI